MDITAFQTVVVAISGNFEANALITSTLKNLGILHVISTSNTNRHREILLRVGADRVILPDEESGNQLADELSIRGMLKSLHQPADGLAENIGVRMAFLNEGTGRAEADAAGGSLTETQQGLAVECWNAAIQQSYISFQVLDNGAPIASAEDGNVADCGLFTASLSELGVPSLDDVDPALRAALDEAATNGIPAQ